jgi:rRNA maturation protein Nop10
MRGERFEHLIGTKQLRGCPARFLPEDMHKQYLVMCW